MKKYLFIILLLAFTSIKVQAQCSDKQNVKIESTSIGIVIYSNDQETIWNAFRFANYSKQKGDTVSIFLLGKGVELDSLVKSNKELNDQVEQFLNSKGEVLGCGTCLKSRNNGNPNVCKFSSLSDLYDLVKKNKIVLTF